jgi:hypothetical protein
VILKKKLLPFAKQC